MVNPFREFRSGYKEKFFVGRTSVLMEIEYRLKNTAFSSFNIFGGPAIGKTWLLKRIKEKVIPNLALEYISIEVAGRDGEEVIRDICEQLWQKLEPGRNPSVEDSIEIALQKLLAYLSKHSSKHGQYVISLDHAGDGLESLSIEAQHQLRALAIYQPLIIITRQPLSSIIQTDSPLYNLLIDLKLGLFSEQEARNFVDNAFKQNTQGQQNAESASDIGAMSNEEMTSKKRFTSEERDFLIQSAGRHPFLLTLVCESYYEEREDNVALTTKIHEDDVKGRLLVQWGNRPAILDMHRSLWTQLNEREKDVLRRIVDTSKPSNRSLKVSEVDQANREWETLDSLDRKSLIEIDVATAHIKGIFSELFRLYVLQQEEKPQEKQAGQFVSPARRTPAINLSERDRRLLQYFRQHVGKVCAFQELEEQLGVEPGTLSSNPDEEYRGLEAAIYRLRAALQKAYGSDEKFIYNRRKVGYTFEGEPES